MKIIINNRIENNDKSSEYTAIIAVFVSLLQSDAKLQFALSTLILNLEFVMFIYLFFNNVVSMQSVFVQVLVTVFVDLLMASICICDSCSVPTVSSCKCDV